MSIEFHPSNFSEIIFAAVSTLVILGHNLWLVAKDEKDKIIIEVNTSDNFPLSDSAVKPERVADFRLVSANDSIPITKYEVKENSLVASIAPNEFACFAALELRPHPIILESEKFAGYIKSEDDEPTSALDVSVSATILRLLAQIAKSGTAIVVVSHDEPMLNSLCQRVLRMHEGVLSD